MFRIDRFERSSSFHVDVVNSLLLVEESLIARTRDRSQDAKNIREKNAIQERNEMINRRTREFEASIHRESSNFERVKAEMTILHNEDVASKIQNVLHRADSALERERERERGRGRGRERARERGQESTIAAEREEILISAVNEEERGRERSRERRRGRERRDRGQAASK